MTTLNASLCGIHRFPRLSLFVLRIAALIGGAECRAWRSRPRKIVTTGEYVSDESIHSTFTDVKHPIGHP